MVRAGAGGRGEESPRKDDATQLAEAGSSEAAAVGGEAAPAAVPRGCCAGQPKPLTAPTALTVRPSSMPVQERQMMCCRRPDGRGTEGWPPVWVLAPSPRCPGAPAAHQGPNAGRCDSSAPSRQRGVGEALPTGGSSAPWPVNCHARLQVSAGRQEMRQHHSNGLTAIECGASLRPVATPPRPNSGSCGVRRPLAAAYRAPNPCPPWLTSGLQVAGVHEALQGLQSDRYAARV